MVQTLGIPHLFSRDGSRQHFAKPVPGSLHFGPDVEEVVAIELPVQRLALVGGGPRVTLAWFKHQGPGDVMFSEQQGRVSSAGGEMTTMATFSEPGRYTVRVRATDSSVSGAGHAQCCWTNGFVRITVTR